MTTFKMLIPKDKAEKAIAAVKSALPDYKARKVDLPQKRGITVALNRVVDMTLGIPDARRHRRWVLVGPQQAVEAYAATLRR